MSPRLVARLRILALAVLVCCLAACAQADPTFVRLETDAGDITLVMAPELAPNHVGNFLHLCGSGFYDGTYFHRVIPGFMIQGGDPNTKDADPSNDGMGNPTLMDVLPAEAVGQILEVNKMLEQRGYLGFATANLMAEFNDGQHLRGTLSMARSQDPNSAGSQFFVCHQTATHLDGQYTAFGRTILGLDVVDAIVGAPQKPGRGNAPVDPVHIVAARILEGVGALNEAEVAAWNAALEAEAAAALEADAASVDGE